VNASNQYTQAKGRVWQYDASGNLTDDGEKSYAWDGANRLVELLDRRTGERHEFQYDGQSRLTVKRSYANGTKPIETRYLWCGERICQKRDGNDNILATYYEEGEQQGNRLLYYVRDHLGSVTDTIDAQGNPQGALDYSPYGETIGGEGALPDFRYAGMFQLPETGLYLTHYRLYDPNSKRWLNRDPIGETGGINLYAYVQGNPVNYVDPTGEFAWSPAIGLGIRIFGGRAAGAAIGGWARANLGKGGLVAACLLAGICNFSEGNGEGSNGDEAKPDEGAKPDREQKPDGCPAGTKPVDKDKRLDREKIHGIKDQLQAGLRDWVGISPDGRIWTNEGGVAADNGPYTDYLP
jgi:RHS repeat-associated protein